MSFNSTHKGIPIAILSAAGVQTGESLSDYASDTNIAKNVETNLTDYTVPDNATLNLLRIEVGGSIAAKFRVYITPFGETEDIVATVRTSDKNLKSYVEFDTTDEAKQTLSEGDKIRVTVEHVQAINGDFESRMQGTLLT